MLVMNQFFFPWYHPLHPDISMHILPATLSTDLIQMLGELVIQQPINSFIMVTFMSESAVIT